MSALSPEEQIVQATELTERLIQATRPLQSNNSLLPNDLGASVRVVTAIIEVLENNNSTNEVNRGYHLLTIALYCMKFLVGSLSTANLGEDIPLPAQANLSQFRKRQRHLRA